jgi:hypothetical protein
LLTKILGGLSSLGKEYKLVVLERADAIVNCGGTRAETRLFVQSVWKPAVEYTLPQSFLSEKQLKSIETASMPKLYAACGYNRINLEPYLPDQKNYQEEDSHR